MNLDIDLHLSQEKTQWIIDINVKHKTTELLGDNIGENHGTLGFGGDIFDTTPKALVMKEKIDNLNFIRIKHFHPVTDTVKTMKRQVTKHAKA